MLVSVALVAAALAYRVAADPVPREPSGASVFNEGTNCTILWDADTTGKWKTMYIELMTGDNFNQTHLKTVGTVDGTDAENHSLSYPCLSVTPNSPIYFYKFTSPDAPADPLFTTRFTIADAQGNSTPATQNQTSSTGETIMYGFGALEDPTQGDQPPNLGAGTSNSTTSAGSSAGASSTSTRTGSTTGTAAPSSTASTSRTGGASQTLPVASLSLGALGAIVATLFL